MELHRVVPSPPTATVAGQYRHEWTLKAPSTNPDVVTFAHQDVLAASQLPESIPDAHGTVTRPSTWH